MPLIVCGMCLFVASTADGQGYDPLHTAGREPNEPVDLMVKDESRQREIPIRVYLPDGKEPAPIILISHGLGGSRRAYGYAAKHWAARGYAVVAIDNDAPIRHGRPPVAWPNWP